MNPNILILLKTLEKNKSSSDIGLWNIEWEVGEFLSFLVSLHKPQNILEVGTSNGFSGIWLAEALSKHNGNLYTIESSPKRIPLAKENFTKSELTNIHFYNGHAPEVFKELPNVQFDMCFFDATKKEYLSFYEGIKKQLSPNALIIADNIASHQDQVQDYLNKVRNDGNNKSVFLNIGTGLELTLFGK